jgi:fructan beta-fructosidase
MSKWGNAGDISRVWECPDFFEMNVEGTAEKKWVLIISAGHPQNSYVGMQYFVGNFDGNTFVPNSNYINPVYLDYGKDFYAGVTYNDAPNNRRIMLGWTNNWEYANDIPTGNIWRGMYSIPRELVLKKNGNEYQIYQMPVAELNSLRQDLFTSADQSVSSFVDLSFKGNSYELELTIEPGTSIAAGIKFLKSQHEEIVLKYDNVSHQLLLDRTNSGNVSFSSRFPSVEKAAVALQSGILKLRILVDKSVVEIFINDGQATLTDLVFPIETEGGIQIFSEGGISVFKSIKAWKIKP